MTVHLRRLPLRRKTTLAALPPSFHKWCARFDDLLPRKAQKQGLKNYLAGLLGESERKNLEQISNNLVGASYNRVHHFLTESPWLPDSINNRRLHIMQKCRQTRISRGFSLIIDDTGHRKSGNFTAGVGRQYLGEVGKVDNGVVVVTSHMYDGVRSLPLDIKLYQHADSLRKGKQDPEFKKKPDLALEPIDSCRNRGGKPGVVLIDGSYGNNGKLMQKIQDRDRTYIVGVAKNRNVKLQRKGGEIKQRLDEVARALSDADFVSVQLKTKTPKTVWVRTFRGRTANLEEVQTFAVIINAPTLDKATKVDYLMTNAPQVRANAEWIVTTYSQRNWVEVFYRDVKSYLGFREDRVRDKNSLYRHFILVFVAYSFILWMKLTGGLRRQWANSTLETFREALEAFRTGVSYRFVKGLENNADVYASHTERLGYIWA